MRMHMAVLSAALASSVCLSGFAYADAVRDEAIEIFKPVPSTTPAVSDNPITPDKIALGKALFFDPRMSASGVFSCNSCHNLATGGDDNLETSIGHGWQKGPRNAPTALNAVFGRRSLVTKFYPDNPFSKKYLMDHKLSADEPFEVDWLTTACLMVRREAVEKCGGLDEVFFVYWVDADWCDRIKRGGWKIYCLPGHQIIHNENLKGKRQKGRRSAKMVIDFHLGAYHYYKNNRAPHTMNPMRWIAAAGLAARGASILAWDVLRQYLPRK